MKNIKFIIRYTILNCTILSLFFLLLLVMEYFYSNAKVLLIRLTAYIQTENVLSSRVFNQPVSTYLKNVFLLPVAWHVFQVDSIAS